MCPSMTLKYYSDTQYAHCWTIMLLAMKVATKVKQVKFIKFFFYFLPFCFGGTNICIHSLLPLGSWSNFSLPGSSFKTTCGSVTRWLGPASTLVPSRLPSLASVERFASKRVRSNSLSLERLTWTSKWDPELVVTMVSEISCLNTLVTFSWAFKVEHHPLWVSKWPGEGRWAWVEADLPDSVPVVLAHDLPCRFGPQRRHVGVLVWHEGRKRRTSHACVASALLDYGQWDRYKDSRPIHT